MTFTLLPAVDVAGGRTVQLAHREGADPAGGDPFSAALAWQAAGAEWIHLVDVDAAFGRGSNIELLAAVVEALDVRVQLSGGVGDDASLEQALGTGCARVNIDATALENPAWCARAIGEHGDRIAVSLDVHMVNDPSGTTAHRLRARGATTDGGDLWEAITRLDEYGCARYVVTDVSRDGSLRGPNAELYRAVTHTTAAPVIASGGISSIADLVGLAEVAAAGANLEGVIVGNALYAGRFTLPEALDAMRPIARDARSAD